MKTYKFPSKSFIKDCKSEVAKNQEFDIFVQEPKKIGMLYKGIPFLVHIEGKKPKFLDIFKLFTILQGVVVVHFYALAAGYELDFSESKSGVLKYRLHD